MFPLLTGLYLCLHALARLERKRWYVAQGWQLSVLITNENGARLHSGRVDIIAVGVTLQ